jgi:hypothetical protein
MLIDIGPAAWGFTTRTTLQLIYFAGEMHRLGLVEVGEMPRRSSRDSISSDFVALAKEWSDDASVIILSLIWEGYDRLFADLGIAGINEFDLERSISQSLEPRIRLGMSGDEPFEIQHGSFERETMLGHGAQPPAYDLAFFLRADERIMWPLEAKVLETDGRVSEYVNDLRNEFLKCRYAPFSSEAAMLGYLLSGTPEQVFRNLEKKIPCTLRGHPRFLDRPAKVSDHVRAVETGKPYPVQFRCHHLIMEFRALRRAPSTVLSS